MHEPCLKEVGACPPYRPDRPENVLRLRECKPPVCGVLEKIRVSVRPMAIKKAPPLVGNSCGDFSMVILSAGMRPTPLAG